MSIFKNFVSEVKQHPYIFGGVAVGVLLLFLWPSSSGSAGTSTSAISAEESQAIADAAQSNTDLQVASDQVLINGQNTAAATAISLAQFASNDYETNQAVLANNYNDDTSVRLAGVAAGAQADQDNAVLASQNSAQNFITEMESAFGVNEGNITTAGLTDTNATVRNETGLNSPYAQVTGLKPEITNLLPSSLTTTNLGVSAATSDTSGAT